MLVGAEVLPVGTTRGASRLFFHVQHGRPTGRPYKEKLFLKNNRDNIDNYIFRRKISLNLSQFFSVKSVKKRTAVEIYLHCGVAIGAPQSKFICTAVQFLPYF